MGVDIRIEKHIPVAAGLGGGSSDAATVLLALNELFHLNLKSEKLAHIALKLGADVPFFLGPSPAWAEGVGERLTPLETGLPPACFVLVNPNVALSTAQVYAHVETYSGCAHKGTCIDTFEMLEAALHNDLEPSAMQLCPQIKEVKADLLECGARGALMSGSGATVFGVFDNRAAAERAARYLQSSRKWWACVVTAVA
jgi:4-diphosphocytidyl-2-C-methyl-D-erythritol kinase